MQVRLLDPEAYEALAPRDFLQSRAWGRQKAAFGWEPWYFGVCCNGEAETPVLVMTRQVFAGKHLAYCPRPDLGSLGVPGSTTGEVLAHLGRELARAIPRSLLLIRFEPPELQGPEAWTGPATLESSEDRQLFLAWRASVCKPHLEKTPADIQPPDTVILPIDADAETILAAMKSKTRYNVRLGAKKGVAVGSGGTDALEAWYGLYLETARRDRISIHDMAYYRRLLEDNPASVDLLMATHEGDLLAGIIVVYHGDTATYLYGASGNLKRNLMPAYALQWEAIQRARARGCVHYDFFGLPPWADEGHPMHGLYQFKTGFGGREVHYPGSWDLLVAPLAGKLFRLVEFARLYYYRNLRKR